MTTTVRMLTLSAGPSGMRAVGQAYALSNDEASALVNGGYAEYVANGGKDGGEEESGEAGTLTLSDLERLPGGKYRFPDGTTVKGRAAAEAVLEDMNDKGPEEDEGGEE